MLADALRGRGWGREGVQGGGGIGQSGPAPGIMNGKAYFNVHTSSSPGGEIAGFLAFAGVPCLPCPEGSPLPTPKPMSLCSRSQGLPSALPFAGLPWLAQACCLAGSSSPFWWVSGGRWPPRPLPPACLVPHAPPRSAIAQPSHCFAHPLRPCWRSRTKCPQGCRGMAFLAAPPPVCMRGMALCSASS